MDDTITAKRLAAVLHEPEQYILQRILRAIGEERTILNLADALTVESNGGMCTSVGDRRTLGGVFLQLCRERMTPAERQRVFLSSGTRQKTRNP